MVIPDRKEFYERSIETLKAILDELEAKPALELKRLEPDNTVLVIVDMVNGFAREGALRSPRIEALIPEIARLSRECDGCGIRKIAFADCHTNESPEFSSYPPHCIAGTRESEIVDELAETGGYHLISKNSTNGFHEESFREWMKEYPMIDTFIIVGDCTDICVEQLSVTLKTHFNKLNRKSRVIVPVNAVDTYDLGMHNGDLMNIMALYSMMGNDVEIVKEIR